MASLEPENHKLTKECKRLQKVLEHSVMVPQYTVTVMRVFRMALRHTHIHTQLVFQADDERRSELQAMRDRHKQRFTEATAKLRSQHKALGKRVRALETQLLKNSVSCYQNVSVVGMNVGVLI